MKILAMVSDDRQHIGLRLAAIKFMHRVIVVQTKGIVDPRVRIPLLDHVD
jgi:symplekin